MQGCGGVVRGTQCVILHQRARTQQKQLPSAALWVRWGAQHAAKSNKTPSPKVNTP